LTAHHAARRARKPSFSDAKAKLSDLMTAVVQDRRPYLADGHRGKQAMLLVGRREVAAMLESFEFRPKVTVSEGEFVVGLPELGVIAGGGTLDEAFDELVELTEEYVRTFFERLGFYMETERRRQFPWLVRFGVTPPDERRDLFVAAGASGGSASQTA
jgi:predicted RNase H-like HicB family nuclease